MQLLMRLFSWNIHWQVRAQLAHTNETTGLTRWYYWQCGSDYVKGGCRDYSTNTFVDLVKSSNADVAVAIELESTSDTSVDFLALPGSPLKGWSQISGSCPGAPGHTGDANALLLDSGYKIRASGGGYAYAAMKDCALTQTLTAMMP
jgi:hypothetical protein